MATCGRRRAASGFRVTGAITASLSRAPNGAGESALGDLIADAQLDATRADDSGGAASAPTL
jgi:5'-nucleotidase